MSSCVNHQWLLIAYRPNEMPGENATTLLKVYWCSFCGAIAIKMLDESLMISVPGYPLPDYLNLLDPEKNIVSQQSIGE